MSEHEGTRRGFDNREKLRLFSLLERIVSHLAGIEKALLRHEEERAERQRGIDETSALLYRANRLRDRV